MPTEKARRCGYCGEEGHNKRSCEKANLVAIEQKDKLDKSRFVILDRVGGSAVESGLSEHHWAKAALWVHRNLHERPEAVIWDKHRKMVVCSKRVVVCEAPCAWHDPYRPALPPPARGAFDEDEDEGGVEDAE